MTYGEAFTVQPFGNSLVTLNLTGAQLLEVLKQQWCGQTAARVLLPSAGVHYTYDLSAAAALVGQPCAGARQPGHRPDDRRRGGGPGGAATASRSTRSSPTAATASSRSATAPTGWAATWTSTRSRTTWLARAPVAPPALDRIDVVP